MRIFFIQRLHQQVGAALMGMDGDHAVRRGVQMQQLAVHAAF